MPTKRLLFDVDGVLCDGIESVVKRYNRRTNSHVKSTDIDRYNYVKNGFDVCAEWNDMWANEPKLSLKMRPARLGQLVLAKLMGDGFEIMAATSRPESAMYWTEKWLRRHQFPTHGLFHVDGPKAELDCDMLFEDNPLEIELFVRAHNKPAFLKRQPWNRHYYPFGYRLFKVYGRNIWTAAGLVGAQHLVEELFLGEKSHVYNKKGGTRNSDRLSAAEVYRLELENQIRLEMGV